MSNRRWLVLTFVFLGIIVSYVDRGNLSVANETIAKALHLQPDVMGRLLSAFFWTYAVFQIPAGAIVDRFGVRGGYAAAFVIWSLASASIALSRGAGDILTSRLILGFAETVGPVASLAAIRASFRPEENGLPTAIYIGGQSFGPSLSLLVGTKLLVAFGWRLMFAITGLAALIWVPAWLWVAPKMEKREKAAPPFDWAAILKQPTLWAMAVFIFLASYYWYFVLNWAPAYLTAARGYTTEGMGKTLSAALAASAVINMASGLAADFFSKKMGSVFAARLWLAGVCCVGSATLVLLNWLPGIAILFVSVISFGIASSNFWTVAQNIAPREKVARVIGFLNTASQVGGIAAPWITGVIIGPQKHFPPAILIAGMCPLVALIPLVIAGRRIVSGPVVV